MNTLATPAAQPVSLEALANLKEHLEARGFRDLNLMHLLPIHATLNPDGIPASVPGQHYEDQHKAA